MGGRGGVGGFLSPSPNRCAGKSERQWVKIWELGYDMKLLVFLRERMRMGTGEGGGGNPEPVVFSPEVISVAGCHFLVGTLLLSSMPEFEGVTCWVSFSQQYIQIK